MTPRKNPQSPDAASPRGTGAPCDLPAPAAAQGDRLPSPSHPRAVAGGPKAPGAAGWGSFAAPGSSPLAAAMSEDELERRMRRILRDLPGILAYHTRDSRKSPGGFPDWCFCAASGVLFRELKRQGKKPTPAQDEWLAALARAGQDAGVWRPSDLLDGTIARELAALAGLVSER
jgi:hypothetical protein